ncbi:SPOC like C-terminal domain-containing protein [Scheffersomyces amazonensis]|uniref:SPOC like C-terminal domain-containing protein n=1 Tax=Scheffersomyces amazonensis TaxID=1078765 RepID=UPI00315C9E35
MASKEYTIFLVDLSPSMGLKYATRNITDLEFGLIYVYDYLANLLLKNRKSDRIALALHNPGDHLNFEILYDDEQFTYEKFKQFASKLKITRDIPDNNDLVKSVELALDQFKSKIHLKFKRQLHIISNVASTSLNNLDEISEYSQMCSQYNIGVSMNIIDLNSQLDKSVTKIKNETVWQQLSHTWSNFKLKDTEQVNKSLSELKVVGPRSYFSGQIRFGTDVEADSELSTNSAITIDVQAYPAVKPENIIKGHDYILDPANHTVHKVKRVTKYYIKKYKGNDNEEEEEGDDDLNEDDEDDADIFEKIQVEGEHEPGFKFSQRDIIVINRDLQEMSKLTAEPGIDILGFIKSKNLPIAYLTGASSYIVPLGDSPSSNYIAFNSLAKSLLDMESLAIVRLVVSSGKEITLNALVPKLVEMGDSKYSYIFIVTRLAFKEDEKMGRFPTLITESSQQETTNDSRNFPSNEIIHDMDSFINSKSLDHEDEKLFTDYISNRKVTENVHTNINNINIDSMLLSESPSAKKYLHYLKRIISSSTRSESLFDYLNNDKLFSELSSDANLFRLSNIFNESQTPGNYLDKITHPDNQVTLKLFKKLDTSYLLQTQKQKRRKVAASAFERFFDKDTKQENFDSFFDVGDILN